MMTTARVLVVDDDASVRSTVADSLRVAGHTAVEVGDGATAIDAATRESFDLVILDVNMPRVDGFTVLEKLRRRKADLPIIMLTARDEREDVVRGLKLGADDYIRKPFGLEEFLLRVSAILRRSSNAGVHDCIESGDVRLDLTTSSVEHAGNAINLSPTEFRLLHRLMLHPGQVLSKSHLLESVWGVDFDTTSTVVETYVSYLRKKLDCEGHEHIKTVRGFGIKFDSLS
jgi:two-component system OmpR family response regulator